MPRNRFAKRTCYMCDKAATSNEHFPPKCFFPNGYRDNLWTVPSCDEHNSKKSTDDEYLLLMIYSSYENDHSMRIQVTNWAERAVRNNPNIRNLFVNSRPWGGSSELIAFDVDQERMNRELEHIARAIYFHEFHDKWPYQIGILCTSLRIDPILEGVKAFESNRLSQMLGVASANVFNGQPVKGSNRKIFYYQLNTNLEQKDLLIRMVFYSGIVVLAYSSPTAKFQ
jgi:hypothetical protein